MSYTSETDADSRIVHEAERLNEFIINQLDYCTYDVDVVAKSDGTLAVQIGPGVAAPETLLMRFILNIVGGRKRPADYLTDIIVRRRNFDGQ